MSKRKILVFGLCAFVTIVVIASIANKTSSSNEKDNESIEFNQTDIISLDDTSMNESIDKILSMEDTTGDVNIDSSATLYVNLMCDSYEIIDKYYGDHALFVKVKTLDNESVDYSMVRFQLNDENKIESCILFQIAN